ncbi:N2227-like protein-domain-containing protein [Hysterangium stoloniferum]|nr:N2227-like protein-domain-containing protein [Hysterangium stoloniferum]
MTIIHPPLRGNNLQAAAAGLKLYSNLANHELLRMRNIYATMNHRHKRIGYDLGYTRKLNMLAHTIEVNAAFTKKISKLTIPSSGIVPTLQLTALEEQRCLERVRDALKQIVREWSSEGADERAQTFSPIMDVFKKVPLAVREETTVLVPGSGLGRLAWEIASMGFATTSNELSPYMNLIFQFLTSRSTTLHVNQHAVHPYAYWFSHQRSNASLFRAVQFPDVLPSISPVSRLTHKESDFLKLSSVHDGFDYIVTHFFIDTSPNIVTTLEKIHSLLKVGGTWINLGPLLWMGGGQTTMELSLEEVFALSDVVGFDIQLDSRQTVRSEYTRDDKAMMLWIYEAEFWTATKR